MPHRFVMYGSTQTDFAKVKHQTFIWCFTLAGAVGIEPTSAVLETAILADELCPFVVSV